MALYVNDIPLDEQEVADEIARLKPKHDEVFRSVDEKERGDQLRAWAKENVIERMLLRQAAEEQGRQLPAAFFDQSFRSLVAEQGDEQELVRRLDAQGTSVGEYRAEFERGLCMERLVDSVTRAVPSVGEQELRDRFEADPARFMTPGVVRAGHIVLHADERRTREEALEGIREVQRWLNEGGAFEELAGLYSDCPENDGDLGYFCRGEMMEEFEAAVFAMHVGEVSGIIETPLGFHIAKLYERRAGSPLPFEKVKAMLLEERICEMKDELLENYIDSLRAAATIVERP